MTCIGRFRPNQCAILSMNKKEVRKLNLGCGNQHLIGYTNIDKIKTKATDKIYDLDLGIDEPDNSIDEIYCSHILEHLDDLIFIMEEIYRVCKNNSRIEIIVPYYLHKLSYGDPTHKHFFTEDTFCYFEEINPNKYITKARFKIERIDYTYGDKGFIKWIPFKNKIGHYIPNIIKELRFVLRVKK